MYESPIELFYRDVSTQIAEQTDKEVMYQVESQMGISINKDELIKALNYDRDQYNKGYADGKTVGYKEAYKQAMIEMGIIQE